MDLLLLKHPSKYSIIKILLETIPLIKHIFLLPYFYTFTSSLPKVWGKESFHFSSFFFSDDFPFNLAFPLFLGQK